MDKKSFWVLLYIAGIIPIIYDIIIRLHVDNPFFVLGLINILCLLIMTMFMGMQKDKADINKRRIKGRLFLVIAIVIAVGLFSGAIDRLLARGSLWFHEMIMRNNQLTIAPTSSDIQSGDILSGTDLSSIQTTGTTETIST